MPRIPPSYRFTTIDDPAAPRLAAYTAARDAAALKKQNAFIAEGRTVVEQLLDSPLYRARSLLVAKSKSEALAPLAARLPPSAPAFALPDELIESVVGFDFHRGVMAEGDAGAPRDPAELIAPAPPLLLALEGVNNHDNAGAAFRNAAAFGAAAVLLDPRSCDPLYRKSIRVSMGHALRVPFARARTSRALNELLETAGYTVIALATDPDAKPLPEVVSRAASTKKLCVLVGAEGPGLSEAARRSATLRARIDMAPGVDSLNLAAAAAIALSAARQALRDAGATL